MNVYGFDEADEGVIKQAFAALHSVNFFSRLADAELRLFVQRFDSLPPAEKSLELDKIAAVRGKLMMLAMESASAAATIDDSEQKEMQGDAFVEESIG